MLRYIDMLTRAAAIQGKRLPNVSVPMLTPQRSALWLSLVTDVDSQTARTTKVSVEQTPAGAARQASLRKASSLRAPGPPVAPVRAAGSG